MKMLRSLLALAILLLMLWACTPSSAPTNIPSSPISTSIPTGSVPTLVPPTPTTAVTPTSNPQITKITIDGKPLDWSGYPFLVADPAGDHKGGGFDIANVRAFTNNKYLYVLSRLTARVKIMCTSIWKSWRVRAISLLLSTRRAEGRRIWEK